MIPDARARAEAVICTVFIRFHGASMFFFFFNVFMRFILVGCGSFVPNLLGLVGRGSWSSKCGNVLLINLSNWKVQACHATVVNRAACSMTDIEIPRESGS